MGWRDKFSQFMVLSGYFGLLQAQQPDDAAKLLDRAATQVDTSAWPYPVIRYLRREINAQDLLALATDNDKLTEARAYIGMLLSHSGQREEALTHLRWVKENGNKTFLEYGVALTEIQRIENASATSGKSPM